MSGWLPSGDSEAAAAAAAAQTADELSDTVDQVLGKEDEKKDADKKGSD